MRMGLRGILGGLAVGVCVVASVAKADVKPAIDPGGIARKVSKLLREHHYSGKALDNVISGQCLTNYLDALDYNRVIFIQADLDRFQQYTTTLDDSILAGNLEPAFEIYACYSNRVEQYVASARQMAREPVRFDTNESIRWDRKDAAWPKDEKEAQQLLRQRVKYELLEERLNKEKAEEAVSIVTRRYDRLARSLRDADTEFILEVFLNALTQAYDPHTQYMTPSSLENFNINMKLSLTGIGAVLRSDDGYARIVEIVPGGPADLDKRLKPNDRICAVAQGMDEWTDVVDMKLNKVVDLIRGPKGTVVRLKVVPASAPDSSVRAEIQLTRDEIKLTAQEAKAKLVEKRDEDGRPALLGYIELPSFYVDTKKGPTAKSATRDVSRLINRLKASSADGLLIDLRRNTGGSLAEAISMTGLFIPEGPVVQVKDPYGRVHAQRDEDGLTAYDGPLVVLVSHLSASAAEIFAAALQDYGRAIIVGDQNTFGKGTVQQIVELDNVPGVRRTGAGSSGALKLTIQKFYRVSGGSTQSRGVVPDIQLPSVFDARPIGEATLPNSLPYDEVRKSDYKTWGVITQYLPELRAHCAQRLVQNPEFKYLQEDIARTKKRFDEKTISLNQAQREAEKKANQDRVNARKKERIARKIEPPRSIEITLENLDGKTNGVAAVSSTSPVAAASAGSEDEPDATDDPSVDTVFDEGLRILTDYVGMVSVMTAQSAR